MDRKASGSTFIKILLLLRAIRWYNVLLVIISQYLVALFIFNAKNNLWDFIYDFRLHLMILSIGFALAGGFIINGFYDIDKDLINKPKKVVFNRFLEQNFLLNMYAALNVFSMLLAIFASLKIFIFVSGLLFIFWFYSHKLQKLPFIREFSATLMAIAPFLAVWLHYGQMHYGMLLWTGSIAIVGFTREVVKDLTGNKGNIIFGYETLVVLTGQSFAKRWLLITNILMALAYAIGFFLFVESTDYFSVISGFSITAAVLASVVCLLAKSENNYVMADTILKITIVMHILSVIALPVIF